MKHFTVKRVAVIQRDGCTDLILIHTDLPSPFRYERDNLTLEFKVPCGDGDKYLREVLGIHDAEIIKG